MSILYSHTSLLIRTVLILLLAGCAHTPEALRKKDRQLQASQVRAVDRALDAAGSSLVFFQVENPNPRRNQPRIVNFSGIVLTPEGHILAPYTIRKESDTRVEAWVEERRYLARSVLVDEGLGMTVMKIEPDTPLTPFDLSDPAGLPLGATVYCVITSDEEREFEPFVFHAVNQGIVQGRYRQYSLSHLPDLARGAPLFDRLGRWVGITSQGNGWAAGDLIEDLEELVDRTLSDSDENGDGESEEAWFGAILSPINTAYARAMNLPNSGLWLSHVFKDGSAYEAGLRSGDLLVEINGSPMRLRGSRAYRFFLQTLRPREGDPFTATVIRDGKEIAVKGRILERPDPDTLRAEDLGITVSDIHESMAIRHNLFETDGVMVVDIKAGSPAATGRTFGEPLLLNFDVITSIGGIETPDVETFGKVLERIREKKPKALLVEFQRGAFTGIEALNLEIGEENRGETQ